MGKKMFNASDRAESVLKYYKDAGVNLSALTSEAIVNYELPQYGVLHTEALYLLDTITNGLQDWRGPGGSRAIPEEPSEASARAVRRAVSWLRNNHIRDCSVLKIIIHHYASSATGVKIEELSPRDRDRWIDFEKKLKKSGNDSTGIHICLGCAGIDMLNSWGSIWDDSETYEMLINIVYLERLEIPFDPFEAIAIMRMLEQTYVTEQIKE